MLRQVYRLPGGTFVGVVGTEIVAEDADKELVIERVQTAQPEGRPQMCWYGDERLVFQAEA